MTRAKITVPETVESCAACPFKQWPENSMHPLCTHLLFVSRTVPGRELLPPDDDPDRDPLDTIPDFCPLPDAPTSPPATPEQGEAGSNGELLTNGWEISTAQGRGNPYHSSR